jgi:tRNA (guanine-N7-)-methyltransferase
MTRCKHDKPLEFSAPWRVAWDRNGPPLDFRALFGNDHEVEIEIGHGKGSFLIEAAAALPNTNFVGMEWSNGRHIFAAERMAKRNYSNVRLLRCDAVEVLAKQLAPRSVRAIHIYFPDPYWKRKHLKRRLVTPEFVTSLASALPPGGLVLTKSDVAERFAVTKETFAASADFLPTPWEEAAARYPQVVSNFERKAQIAGRHVECASYVRR